MEYLMYRQDVCEVKGETEYNGMKYYVLVPLSDKSLSLKIPKDNAFIRPLLTKKEVEGLIEEINKVSTLDLTEKNLEMEYQKLLATSSPKDLITIVRTAYLRNKQRAEAGKKESDKDTYYLKKAENLLYTELAMVLEMDKDEVRDYIIKRLSSN